VYLALVQYHLPLAKAAFPHHFVAVVCFFGLNKFVFEAVRVLA
jgi:hypothetical protein